MLTWVVSSVLALEVHAICAEAQVAATLRLPTRRSLEVATTKESSRLCRLVTSSSRAKTENKTCSQLAREHKHTHTHTDEQCVLAGMEVRCLNLAKWHVASARHVAHTHAQAGRTKVLASSRAELSLGKQKTWATNLTLPDSLCNALKSNVNQALMSCKQRSQNEFAVVADWPIALAPAVGGSAGENKLCGFIMKCNNVGR